MRQGERSPEETYEAVLAELRLQPNVSRACRLAGMTASAFYQYCKRHPDYKERVRMALREGADRAEEELWRRGVEGFDKPVIHKGVITDTYKDYSDVALLAILNARHELYDRTRKVDITSDGKALQQSVIYLPVVEGEILDELPEASPAQLPDHFEDADV